MALALMPRDEVMNGFNSIRIDAEQLPGDPMAAFLSYFETTWLSNVDLWNVFACDSRTNNVCEGKHPHQAIQSHSLFLKDIIIELIVEYIEIIQTSGRLSSFSKMRRKEFDTL